MVSTAGCPSRAGREDDGPPGACIVKRSWACRNLEEEHSGLSEQLPRCLGPGLASLGSWRRGVDCREALGQQGKRGVTLCKGHLI